MDSAGVPEQVEAEPSDAGTVEIPVVEAEQIEVDIAESPVVDYEAERAADLATLARVEAELAEIEQAMRAIEEGTYGVCEQCGAPVAEEVLTARPTARRCAAHESGPAAAIQPPSPTPLPHNQGTR